MYDLSRTERQHRAINNETTTGALIPKRCVCGRTAFAKQLEQHGVCVACQFDERAATLQPEDLDILRHMLGATPHHPRLNWGFRNHYLANRQDLPLIERLVAAGFVRAGGTLLHLQYFHGTSAGCKLAGVRGKRADMALALGVRP
jgi:hypothetical protein